MCIGRGDSNVGCQEASSLCHAQLGRYLKQGKRVPIDVRPVHGMLMQSSKSKINASVERLVLQSFRIGMAEELRCIIPPRYPVDIPDSSVHVRSVCFACRDSFRNSSNSRNRYYHAALDRRAFSARREEVQK